MTNLLQHTVSVWPIWPPGYDEVLCKQNPSETPDHGSVHRCAIVYEKNVDFGYVNTVDPSKSPDQLLLSHLTEQQQKEQLAVLGEFPQLFSDNPGFCNVVQHKIHVTSDFKAKRLRYKATAK